MWTFSQFQHVLAFCVQVGWLANGQMKFFSPPHTTLLVIVSSLWTPLRGWHLATTTSSSTLSVALCLLWLWAHCHSYLFPFTVHCGFYTTVFEGRFVQLTWIYTWWGSNGCSKQVWSLTSKGYFVDSVICPPKKRKSVISCCLSLCCCDDVICLHVVYLCRCTFNIVLLIIYLSVYRVSNICPASDARHCVLHQGVCTLVSPFRVLLTKWCLCLEHLACCAGPTMAASSTSSPYRVSWWARNAY